MKITPICPACKTKGNMAGMMDGPIFCVTCGGRFTAQEIWDFMKSRKLAPKGKEKR